MGVPRPARLVVTVLVAVVVLAGGALAALRVARPGALPGVTVAGVDVGGLEEAELERRMTALARARRAARVTLVRRATEGAGEASTAMPAGELGARLDVDATVDAILAPGRDANPIAALADHVRAFAGPTRVAPVVRVDDAVLRARLARASQRLVAAPREGDVEIRGATVTRVDPAPGAEVVLDELRPDVRAALLAGGDRTVEVPTRPVEPDTTTADVDAAVRAARVATSAPIRLTRGDAALVLSPRDVGRTLDVTVERAGDARLVLSVSPGRLEDVVGERAAALETEPQDARLVLAGGRVRVVPARPGFRFSAETAAAQVRELAGRRDDRSATLRGETVAAELTTSEARALDVDERVSSFTTYHACCEPRVHNIHRIADIVDGAVVLPGETFSLNGYVGPRTRANGFVGAPAIRDGEYVDEIGGGISQFATTLFNAIFFGGYDFLEYKAHSYYIDRYPMGREATVSTPAPDLAFRNDSDAGILIDTSYTDTSITVTFYGSTERDVRAIMGEPYNFEPPPTQVQHDPSLRRGETVVVQEGTRGFDVVVKRVISGPGGESTVEEFFTRYLPQPRIVARNRSGRG
ncbi:MAG TPA: VanW family protein [Actinomycetota bacterium]|nr:VanW family protein [Actinomycetota bacterium]